METAEEAKVAPKSPKMEKGWSFWCEISEQSQNGKARAPYRMGESEDRGQKKVKALKYKCGTYTLENIGFDWGTLEW